MLFWLNPTGHSKFHYTSNHPPSATDPGRTAGAPLHLPVQALPPHSLPLDREAGEGRHLCPGQACATTACSERLLPTLVGLLVLHWTCQYGRSPLIPSPWTEKPAKADTCARDRRALQLLALNVYFKLSNLT